MPKPVLISRYKFCLKKLLPICQSGTPEKLTVGDAPQQWYAPSLHHGLGHVVFRLFEFLRNDLVDDDTGHADIVVLAENAVQLQFVKGFPETTVGAVERSTNKCFSSGSVPGCN